MSCGHSQWGRVVNDGTCKDTDRGTGCGARIWWVRTKRQRTMPVDPDTDTPHHATCPGIDRQVGAASVAGQGTLW